ncbi:MAG: hypothetical protein CM15mP115_12210 [Alphaproteobacteria bacterium]|nr:MAG: hypothetical protein CM15mP115_12210 [Alphaproteobacteria bacterium]
MSTEYNAVQESIKIALDAADAATDVTSEYNKTKREHKKLEASVKSVHRFSIIIFTSSMVAAVAACYFKPDLLKGHARAQPHDNNQP